MTTAALLSLLIYIYSSVSFFEKKKMKPRTKEKQGTLCGYYYALRNFLNVETLKTKQNRNLRKFWNVNNWIEIMSFFGFIRFDV